MNNSNDLRTKLMLPPPFQIGVVVRDMQKAVDYYSSLGIRPFRVYEFSPDKQWIMEKPSAFKLLLGKAMWGEIELELLQPLEGESPHKDFLESQGEGIQHLGFLVPNYDEWFSRFITMGFEPLTRIEMYVEEYNGYIKDCYFDTRRIGGFIFEIMWKSWLSAASK